MERDGAVRGHWVVMATVCVGVNVGVRAESQLELGLEFYQEDQVKIRNKGRMDPMIQAAWKECEARKG